MTICVVCKREKTSGEKQYAYTGKYLCSSEFTRMDPVGPFSTTTATRTAYTDFMKHEFFVCSDCRRSARILNMVILAPTLLLTGCAGIMTLFTKGKTFVFFCVGSVLVLFLGAGILAFLQRVVFRNDIWDVLEKEALLQRGGETGIHVFSESDYNEMTKSS